MHINALYKIYINYIEKIKWFCIITIILLIVFSYYFFLHHSSKILKIIFFMILSGILIKFFFQKKISDKLVVFIKNTQLEFYNLVWPDYKATIKTTGIVLILITLTSILLWLLDGIIFYFISWILIPR